jgi:hypothetical protein
LEENPKSPIKKERRKTKRKKDAPHPGGPRKGRKTEKPQKCWDTHILGRTLDP